MRKQECLAGILQDRKANSEKKEAAPKDDAPQKKRRQNETASTNEQNDTARTNSVSNRQGRQNETALTHSALATSNSGQNQTALTNSAHVTSDSGQNQTASTNSEEEFQKVKKEFHDEISMEKNKAFQEFASNFFIYFFLFCSGPTKIHI